VLLNNRWVKSANARFDRMLDATVRVMGWVLLAALYLFGLVTVILLPGQQREQRIAPREFRTTREPIQYQSRSGRRSGSGLIRNC
jgi:hypothetical protein